MEEVWKDIPDYPGYQVSTTGKVRSFWKKRKKKGSWGGSERILTDESYELLQSDDGNGYMKVYMQNGDHRVCKKVHRLVAEAFVENPNNYDTVDHINSGAVGKLDNSVENLRWLSRRENIQKAYKDGMCDERIERSKKPVMCRDVRTNELEWFDSLGEAAEAKRVDRSCVSRARSSSDEILVSKAYLFYEPDPEDILLYRPVEDDIYD